MRKYWLEMKFLNLDLDFFLDNIVYLPRGLKRRPNKKRYHPWPEADVRDFLERQCGLNARTRIPGRLGINHDEVFDSWKNLTLSGEKLDIAHVDAHGDLSGQIDEGALVYLPGKLLSLPVEERLNQIGSNRKFLTLANYMSFAVACRWVERIEFVTHPNWTPESGDPLDYFFRNKSPATGLLELRHTDINDRLINCEPAIPYYFTQGTSYRGGGFCCAFLSHSPNYTPSTADKLIPVFRDYIDL